MRKCISCNIGCADHRIARSRPLRCSINPDIIHGDAYKMRRVNRDTNVVVIGAGTAGMEAACTAAEVGCHTWLLEAGRRGFSFRPASASDCQRHRLNAAAAAH